MMLMLILALLSAPPQWELVATIDPYNTVYVEPSVCRPQDQDAMNRLLVISEQVLAVKQGEQKKRGAVIVDFFTDRSSTPQSIPYSDSQKAAWRARVTYPVDGDRSFQWDPKQ